MSRIWFVCGLIILSLFCLLTTAKSDSVLLAEKADEQEHIRQQISELISELDSNQRVIRQQAEIQLVALGKPVLSLLPPPELVSSNSVREALQRVKLQIEKQVAKDSIKASHVNLKGPFPLNRILSTITDQTGNQLETTDLSEALLKTTVDVSFVDLPFWQTIDDLTRKLPLNYQINGSSGHLMFRQDTEKQHSKKATLPVCYNGPFRIEADEIQRRPLVGSINRELLRTTFLIQVEPRLRPLFLSYAAADLKAVGDSKLILHPFNPYAKYELPLGEGGKDLKFIMQWILDSKQRPETIQIQGHLNMELAAETLPITFDDLLQSQGAIRRRGNVSVDLIDTEKVNRDSTQDLNIRIALSYDYGGPAFESHRTWIYHNRAYLQDSQGKKYWLNGSSQTTLEAAGKISVLYRFTDLPRQQDNYQFTYLAPTLITSAPIELRFEKLEIPAKATLTE